MIRAEIEIAAPPSVVRDVFLDFPNLSEWHTSAISAIESQTPGKTTGHDMVPGDKILCKISGAYFYQTVQENSPTEFRWIGTWHGILTGMHTFCWLPSKTTPNGTTFVQSEEFSGLMAWFMKPGMMGGKQTFTALGEVNRDLKARAESMANKKGAEV